MDCLQLKKEERKNIKMKLVFFLDSMLNHRNNQHRMLEFRRFHKEKSCPRRRKLDRKFLEKFQVNLVLLIKAILAMRLNQSREVSNIQDRMQLDQDERIQC